MNPLVNMKASELFVRVLEWKCSFSRAQTQHSLYALKQVCTCSMHGGRSVYWCVDADPGVCLGGFGFDFFSSSLRPNAPPLCSKDKFGRFANFLTFHWWPPLTPLPGLWCFPSCLSHVWVRLGSIHCQFDQTEAGSVCRSCLCSSIYSNIWSYHQSHTGALILTSLLRGCFKPCPLPQVWNVSSQTRGSSQWRSEHRHS